jgi:hypothetical protein
MSTPQEKMLAFQSAQKFGKQYPGLLDALQEWAAIGSLEQAADEARQRLEAARAEEQALTGALESKVADANATAQRLTAEAERELANRRAIAAALVDEAKLEARCIVDAARTRAAGLIEDAEKGAAECQSRAAAARLELAALSSRIEAKSGELAAISAAVEEKQAQHQRFAELIAEIKTKL